MLQQVKPLTYPEDRHLGYVLLSHPSGYDYVPEFKDQNDPLKYCQAFMALARRKHG